MLDITCITLSPHKSQGRGAKAHSSWLARTASPVPPCRASPAPGHVSRLATSRNPCRKPAVSRYISSHVFQTQSDDITHHLPKVPAMLLGPRIALSPERGELSTQGFGFCDWAVLAQAGACAVQWLWRWAAVAGLPLGLVHGRPPSGPLASRIAVAFPRPGPPEAQCFLMPLLSANRLLRATSVPGSLGADTQEGRNNGSWFQKPWFPGRGRSLTAVAFNRA